MAKDTLFYNNKKGRWEYEDKTDAKKKRYMLFKLMEEKDAELNKISNDRHKAGFCPKCGMVRPYPTYKGRCQDIFCSYKFI